MTNTQPKYRQVKGALAGDKYTAKIQTNTGGLLVTNIQPKYRKPADENTQPKYRKPAGHKYTVKIQGARW